MIDRIAATLQRIIPDPFAIAMLLTLVAFLAAMVFGELPTLDLIDAWAAGPRGFWALLRFAMQMCMILVTGFAVASTRPVQRALRVVAGIPKNTAQAVAIVAVLSMALALVNWGLGLIAGALLAREVGLEMTRRGIPVHYPLLGAAGYTGLCVWHGGLSGSAPLKVTQNADLVEVLGPDLAARIGSIPLSETVLSPRNLVVTVALLVIVPVTLALLVPKDASRFTPPPKSVEPPPPEDRARGGSVAQALESTPLLVVPIALLMAVWVVRWVADGGLMRLDPNAMNFTFLLLGLVLAGSPRRYMEIVGDGARACAGIIVQFPFYAGILGILVSSGLAASIAAALPDGGASLALASFGSAGLLNLFVPSGGGQWSIQGPLVMEAGIAAGLSPGRLVMAVAYGDQWTNLLQPFWALPLLGITGARAGDILGYTAILAVVTGVVFALGVGLG